MKLLFLTTLLATICYVSAGKTARLLAAMNAMGMGVNPAGGLLGAGLVRPIMVPGGGGFIGQPQFAQFVPAPMYPAQAPAANQFVPGLPPFGVPAAPIPNMYPAQAPAANQYPYMGVPQMAPFNPGQPIPQQQQAMGGFPMANMQQQPQQQQPFPAQPDPLQRFRRQVMIPDNTAGTTVDTQIPSPTEMTGPCSNEANDQKQLNAFEAHCK